MKNNKKDMLKLAAALAVGCGAVTTALAYDQQQCNACYGEYSACDSGAALEYTWCIENGGNPDSCDSTYSFAMSDCESALMDCESSWCC